MQQYERRTRVGQCGTASRRGAQGGTSDTEDLAGATRARERFPSSRATRLGLLVLVPGALLLGSAVASWAQSLQRWADGDTLTAEALNGQFDVLQARIDALAAAQSAPVTLSPGDARQDDLRWSLVHAAAVGACAASEGTRFASAQTLPRAPSESCGDVCSAVYGVRAQCMAAVSVGQILTERATGRVSVGHSFRYSCDSEDNGLGAPLEFDEAALLEGDDLRERLLGGYAQYCCCGVDVTPVFNDSGGGG